MGLTLGRTLETLVVRFIIVLSLGIALIAVAATNFSRIVQQSPVLTADNRLVGLNGDWRIGIDRSMHHAGWYYRGHAFRYLEDAIASDNLAHFEYARSAAERGLQAAPMDPFLWSILAWSNLFLGQDETAWTALDRSWTIAPNTFALAEDRIRIAAALLETAEEGARVEAPDGMLLDILFLYNQDRDAWTELAGDSPLLQEFNGLLATLAHRPT